MNEDVIKYVEEIVEAKTYNRQYGESFYVYLLPKTDDAPLSVPVVGMSSYNKEDINLPLRSNMWNPIIFKSINVTDDILANFVVFVGLSYVKI